jgi:hypothetical protein
VTLITISAGAPTVEPGTYPVTVTDVVQKTIQTHDGPMDIIDWTFAIDGTDQTVKGSTSMMSGPKSKNYAWLTALGFDLNAGMGFGPSDIIGRSAYASVVIKANGYSAVDTLVRKPKDLKTTRQPGTPEDRASGFDLSDPDNLLPF